MPNLQDKKKTGLLFLIIILAILGFLLVALLSYKVLVTGTSWIGFSLVMIIGTTISTMVL